MRAVPASSFHVVHVIAERPQAGDHRQRHIHVIRCVTLERIVEYHPRRQKAFLLLVLHGQRFPVPVAQPIRLRFARIGQLFRLLGVKPIGRQRVGPGAIIIKAIVLRAQRRDRVFAMPPTQITRTARRLNIQAHTPRHGPVGVQNVNVVRISALTLVTDLGFPKPGKNLGVGRVGPFVSPVLCIQNVEPKPMPERAG